jgi:glutamate-1-semialdehyde 2,1-aminomutase
MRSAPAKSATRRDALLIVDDVRAGFRMARDCSWSLVGVQPDLSCWGKAIANGYPISALLGCEQGARWLRLRFT